MEGLWKRRRRHPTIVEGPVLWHVNSHDGFVEWKMDLVHCYRELPSVEIDKRAALIQWREYYNSMDRQAVLQYNHNYSKTSHHKICKELEISILGQHRIHFSLAIARYYRIVLWSKTPKTRRLAHAPKASTTLIGPVRSSLSNRRNRLFLSTLLDALATGVEGALASSLSGKLLASLLVCTRVSELSL